MSDKTTLNIYQRINAVMKEVRFIQKDAKILNYKAVTHDNLVSVVRASMIANGIAIKVSQISGSLCEREVNDGVTSKMRMYIGKYRINLINIDNPEDMAGVDMEAHALDNGDKAPGKCCTYATKTAILKMFWLETGENDESRAGSEPYTDDEKEEFDSLVDGGKALEFYVFTKFLTDAAYTGLANSFPKGKKSSGKETLRKLEMAGAKAVTGIAEEIKSMLESDDPAIHEVVGELSSREKMEVAKRLTLEEVAKLKEIRG